MNTELLIALLGFAGTIIGSGVGAYGGLRLTSYRLEQLEKKVDKHNSVIERTFVLEERQNNTDQRLDALERHEEQRGRR